MRDGSEINEFKFDDDDDASHHIMGACVCRGALRTGKRRREVNGRLAMLCVPDEASASRDMALDLDSVCVAWIGLTWQSQKRTAATAAFFCSEPVYCVDAQFSACTNKDMLHTHTLTPAYTLSSRVASCLYMCLFHLRTSARAQCFMWPHARARALANAILIVRSHECARFPVHIGAQVYTYISEAICYD